MDLWFLLGVRRSVKHKAGVQTDPCLIGRENAGDCFDIVGPLNGKLIIQSLLANTSLTEYVRAFMTLHTEQPLLVSFLLIIHVFTNIYRLKDVLFHNAA